MIPLREVPAVQSPACKIEAEKIEGVAIEVIAVEHCNLACRSCSHLSPLFPRRFVPVASIEADLARLATCFHANEARLLGGEPTLHPQIVDLINVLRRSGVADRIGIETNGTLLARMPELFWELIDDVSVTIYPGHELSTELESSVLRLTEKHGVNLVLGRTEVFRESYASLGTSDERLVKRIYDTCKVAHEWRCYSVIDGRFYKCPQSYSLPRILGPIADADADSVDLNDPSDLRQRLLAYLQSQKPLRSCGRCLGTVGKVFPYSEPERKLWSVPQQHITEDLINWRQLERDEHKAAMLLDEASLSNAVRTITAFDLLKAFPRAAVNAVASQAVQLTEMNISGDERSALFMHSGSSAEFPEVHMTSESIFCAGIGIQPEAWEASKHGVIFKVSVRVANEETVQIYSRRLDPRARAEDRNWIEVRVPLDRYFGMAVKVILSTEPAFENDVDYGWAAWSEPRVQLNVQ